MTPAAIKSLLDAGALKIVGHRDINGHHTIGLREPWARGYRELWVDSKTFLPVRTISADFANQKGPLQNVMLIDNDSWLPRTKALLEMVNHVHIPAGFAQVPHPSNPPARTAAATPPTCTWSAASLFGLRLCGVVVMWFAKLRMSHLGRDGSLSRPSCCRCVRCPHHPK